MLVLNRIYRIKTGYGHIDDKYRHNDRVKFIQYRGASIRGHFRIKYDLLDFKGNIIGRGNKFHKKHVDSTTYYTINR